MGYMKTLNINKKLKIIIKISYNKINKTLIIIIKIILLILIH